MSRLPADARRRRTTCGLMVAAVLICAATCAWIAQGMLGGVLVSAAACDDVALTYSAASWGADIEDREEGRTPLFVAVEYGHARAAAALLELGADPNGLNPVGAPLLADACGEGRVEVARVLVQFGANVHIRPHGASLIAVARQRNLPELVQLLKKAGARE